MSRDTTISDAPYDIARVQEQLLDMLRSAGTEPPPREPSAVVAATATAAAVKLTGAPPAAGEDCPQCGSDTPWGRSNWCPECGYFPKAGFAGTGIVDDEIRAPANGALVVPRTSPVTNPNGAIRRANT